jgi:ADP-ribose pyrophosphatase YjhB (NUDIX family)
LRYTELLGERAEDAVHREVIEEIGTGFVIDRLLGVVENLFVLDGQPGHEIDFLFHGSLTDDASYERDHVDVLDVPGLRAVWWSLRHASLASRAGGSQPASCIAARFSVPVIDR